jgi:hypothetical protein
MKKALFLIVISLLIVSSCSLFSPNPAKITEVEEFSSKDIGDSGASDVPSDEEGLAEVFTSIDAGSDPLLQDIVTAVEEKGSFSQKTLNYAKSLGSSFASQIEEVQQSIEDFPSTKKIDETISLSGEDIGRYLVLTKGEASLSATASTSDGGDISEDLSNLKSLSAEATLQIAIDPTDALADASSAIKDAQLKLNAGGKGSVTMKKNADGSYTPDKITLEYAESFGFGLAVNADGKGGKIVIKEDASFSGSVDYSTIEANSDNPDELAALFVPQITIIVKVYNDANELKLNKTYTSIDEFETAFSL